MYSIATINCPLVLSHDFNFILHKAYPFMVRTTRFILVVYLFIAHPYSWLANETFSYVHCVQKPVLYFLKIINKPGRLIKKSEKSFFLFLFRLQIIIEREHALIFL